MLNFDIKKHISKLNNSEFTVLDYIVTNQMKVKDMSIEELADACFVSKTTVVRLAQKLGFRGYSELRYELNRSIEETQSKIESISNKWNNFA